jgi:hypothetical protein
MLVYKQWFELTMSESLILEHSNSHLSDASSLFCIQIQLIRFCASFLVYDILHFTYSNLICAIPYLYGRMAELVLWISTASLQTILLQRVMMNCAYMTFRMLCE